MKNIIYTLIKLSTVLLIGLVFVPTAQAASFNTDAQDYPTVQVANYTKNSSCSTCWSSSVTADAGDIITFKIFYHNTGSDDATQTRVRLDLPTGTLTSQTISGQVWASNAPATSGLVRVNLTSTQTLSLIPNNVFWYRYTTLTSLLAGQTGSEVITAGGLDLGTISSGWDNSGYVLIRAQVSGTPGTTTNTGSNSNFIFTNPAFAISTYSAVLSGTVNTVNQSASVWFEFGTSSSNLGNSTPIQTVGINFTPQNFDYVLNNLSPNTTYYFRAVARNNSGSNVYGSTQWFSTGSTNNTNNTVPSVVTLQATSVSDSSATLNVSVNGSNYTTDYWFEYGTSSNSLGYTTQIRNMGAFNSSLNFNDTVTGLMNNTIYYFRGVARNSQGVTYGNTLSFVTSGQGGGINYGYNSVPTVVTNPATSINLNSATLSATIDANGYNTDYWFEYGTTNSLGYTTEYRNLGSYDYSLTQNAYISGLLPNNAYYFRAVARNTQGVTYGNILSFTTSQNTNSGVSNKPNVTTASALFIGSNSALLNGTIVPNGALTTGWFEWSDNAGMASNVSRTVSQTMGQGYTDTYHSYLLSGLTTGKTYYFRVVAQNSYGVSYGEIKSFVPQVAVVAGTGTSTGSTGSTIAKNNTAKVLELTSSFDKKGPNPGDEIVLTIQYKNISEEDISNALLKVALPNEIEYIDSSFTNVNKEGNNLSLQVGKLEKGASGSVSIKVKISDLTQTERMIFSSIMTYSTKDGNGSEILNSELDLKNSSLAASVLETLGFIFGNLFVDFILGLLIGAGAYHYWMASRTTKLDTEDPLK